MIDSVLKTGIGMFILGGILCVSGLYMYYSGSDIAIPTIIVGVVIGTVGEFLVAIILSLKAIKRLPKRSYRSEWRKQ